MFLCGLTSSFSWAPSASIILVEAWLGRKVQNGLIHILVSWCWLSVECLSSPFHGFSSSTKSRVTSLHGIPEAVFQEGKARSCTLSWGLGFTCTSSFLPHSIGQNTLQGQTRFKVWEQTPCLDGVSCKTFVCVFPHTPQCIAKYMLGVQYF